MSSKMRFSLVFLGFTFAMGAFQPVFAGDIESTKKQALAKFEKDSCDFLKVFVVRYQKAVALKFLEGNQDDKFIVEQNIRVHDLQWIQKRTCAGAALEDQEVHAMADSIIATDDGSAFEHLEYSERATVNLLMDEADQVIKLK